MNQMIALPAILTAETVVAAQAQMLRRIQETQTGTTLFMDASGVQTFDSAGLALLLACHRAVAAQGMALQVHNWPQSLQALAHIYGVLPLLAPQLADSPCA